MTIDLSTVDTVAVTTFGDLLLDAADRWPDREALVFPDERLNYAELAAEAIGVARGLVALGVRPGDHVGLLMPNCPAFVHGFFGAALAGAVVVPVNARFKRRELAYVVENADLTVLLTSDVVDEHVDFVDLLHDSLPGLAAAPDPVRLDLTAAPVLRSVVLLGRAPRPGLLDRETFAELAETVPEDVVMATRSRVRLRDVGLMPYTSGTTSYPKGCLLTHEAIVRDWVLAGRRFGVRDGDRFWNPCPMFHMSGIGPMIFTVAVGGAYVTATHFDPAIAVRQIADERADVIYPTFPPITMSLLRHPAYDPAAVAHVRASLNVAPPDTLRVMQELLPTAVQISCFGITEGSGVITYNDPSESLEDRINTCGPPLPGIEVRIVDPETLEERPIGEPGEILFRGFNAFEGYYKDPEKTAATIIEGGWVRTGDLGTVDATGKVSYVGRYKDMLKVGGENVAPSEIEALLSTHPAVKVVQVVGRPDERLVEVPVAFVELVPGETVDPEDLIALCQGQLASFKIPREVRFVDEWPMSATKIQKYKLRELLA